VFLDPDASGELAPLAVRDEVAASRAARFVFSAPAEDRGPGLRDYSGPLVSPFELEQLAHGILARQCREFMLDVHLLMRAAFASVRARWGAEVARELAREQWAAVAPVYGSRIRRVLGIEGDDMEAILKALQVDPGLPHEYVRSGFAIDSPSSGRFWIEGCEAFADEEADAWLALLDDADRPGFEPVVTAVNPRARCIPTGKRAWRIEIDANAEPRAEAPMANAVRVSNVAAFDLDAERDA